MRLLLRSDDIFVVLDRVHRAYLSSLKRNSRKMLILASSLLTLAWTIAMLLSIRRDDLQERVGRFLVLGIATILVNGACFTMHDKP